MLSGVVPMAFATMGTAVFRIVVSSDSMKNATATSHGSTRRMAGDGVAVVRISVAKFPRDAPGTAAARSCCPARARDCWTRVAQMFCKNRASQCPLSLLQRQQGTQFVSHLGPCRHRAWTLFRFQEKNWHSE